MIVAAIILICVSILMFIKPDIFWMITEAWKSNNADEPSKLFILSTRIGAIFMFSVCTVYLIVTLI